MRVLHLIKSLGRGGAEMLLPETLALHNPHQFQFHCIYFLPWKDQLVKPLQEAGATVLCLSASNNLAILFKVFALRRYVKKNQIELVHCHLPWAGFAGRILKLISGIPVIYTEHNKQERYHGITRLLNRFTFNWQTRAIAVSEDVRNSIISNIHPSIQVATILNGVNTNRFQRDLSRGSELRAKLNIASDKVVIGTIAVFRFQKRLVEWIEVAAGIHASHPEVVFIIVGDGPLKNELEASMKKWNLGNCIYLPGLQEDVLPWLSAIDIYMMSSVFEGLPIALLEAMSMQCAILTTDAGGVKEVVRDGIDGLMVPTDQWKLLSDRAGELIANKTMRNALATAARQRVEQSFSLKRMVKELEELYQNVILR